MIWFEIASAMTCFFVCHAIPVQPAVRPRIEALIGRRGFTIGYSILSLALLGWLTSAAGRAPFIEIWPWAPWQNRIALAAMLLVCLLVALSIGRANPFSFGGGEDAAFDPDHPGIVRVTRHPLLVALALWGAAHLLANGDLAHLVVFAPLTVFALLGGLIIDRRKRHDIGPVWARLLAETRARPLYTAPSSWPGFWARCGLGVALYCGLLWLHPHLFGVSPLI